MTRSDAGIAIIALSVCLVILVIALVILTVGRMRHNWRIEFERSLEVKGEKDKRQEGFNELGEDEDG